MKEKSNLPPVIYKYEPYNTYSLRNLKNAQIYFNRPIDFNDPFECSFYSAYDENDILKLYNKWISNKLEFPGAPPPPPGLSRTFDSIEDVPNEFKNSISKTAEEVEEEKRREYLYKIGCSCFSEIKDSLLMWSHYSDSHKGFCLEFDTTFVPFNNAFKVEYSDSCPHLNPLIMFIDRKEFEMKSDKERFLSLWTKYSCWEYEKEWRIFHSKPKKKVGYEVNALKAVYFGSKIKRADLEIICLTLQSQNPKVTFYMGKRADRKYKVEFEKVAYTPYIKINKTT